MVSSSRWTLFHGAEGSSCQWSTGSPHLKRSKASGSRILKGLFSQLTSRDANFPWKASLPFHQPWIVGQLFNGGRNGHQTWNMSADKKRDNLFRGTAGGSREDYSPGAWTIKESERGDGILSGRSVSHSDRQCQEDRRLYGTVGQLPGTEDTPEQTFTV